jgi:hypothetical protein
MHKTLLALALLAIPVWADTLDYQFSQMATHFDFPQFNSALGELTFIDFSLRAQFSGSVTYSNNSDTTGYFQLNFIPKFIVTAAPVSFTPYFYPMSQIVGPTIGMIGGVGAQSEATQNYARFAGGYTSPTNFSPFIGDGEWALDGFETIDLLYFYTSQDPNIIGPNMTRNPAQLEAFLQYSYTPIEPQITENPEPVFYSVVGLMLAGMLLARRKHCE